MTPLEMAGAVAVAGVFGYVGFMFIRSKLRVSDAQSWPSAQATIQSAHVGIVEHGRSTMYYVRCAYSFTVNNEYHGGFTDRRVHSEQTGIQYARWVEGKTVPIRYKPDNPDSSEVLNEDWIAGVGEYPEV